MLTVPNTSYRSMHNWVISRPIVWCGCVSSLNNLQTYSTLQTHVQLWISSRCLSKLPLVSAESDSMHGLAYLWVQAETHLHSLTQPQYSLTSINAVTNHHHLPSLHQCEDFTSVCFCVIDNSLPLISFSCLPAGGPWPRAVPTLTLL